MDIQDIRQEKLNSLMVSVDSLPGIRTQNRYGLVEKLQPGLTGTLLSVTAKDYALWGFRVTGFGDARVILKINGKPFLPGRISSNHLVDDALLPYAQTVPDGTVIELCITNLGSSKHDYEGTLFGERTK